MDNFNLQSKPKEYFSQNRPEMIPFIPQQAKKILDVGCGVGLFAEKLKEQNQAEAWGVEFDARAGAEAKNKLDKVLIGDIMILIAELPDNYFDCIIFNDLLEHLADPFALLKQIKTKLSPQGVIVCSLPNVRYLPNLFNLLIKKQWAYEDQGVLDKTHLRFFTAKSIAQMFKQLDYQIIKLQGINPITSWKFKLINILTLGFLSDTKFLQFACVARP